MKVATQAAATDPITGEIDMDAINTGITFSSKKLVTSIVSCVKEYLGQNQEMFTNKTISYVQLHEEIKVKILLRENLNPDQPFNDKEFEDALNILEEENYIIKVDSTNRKRPNFKLGSGNIVGTL